MIEEQYHLILCHASLQSKTMRSKNTACVCGFTNYVSTVWNADYTIKCWFNHINHFMFLCPHLLQSRNHRLQPRHGYWANTVRNILTKPDFSLNIQNKCWKFPTARSWDGNDVFLPYWEWKTLPKHTIFSTTTKWTRCRQISL